MAIVCGARLMWTMVLGDKHAQSVCELGSALPFFTSTTTPACGGNLLHPLAIFTSSSSPLLPFLQFSTSSNLSPPLNSLYLSSYTLSLFFFLLSTLFSFFPMCQGEGGREGRGRELNFIGGVNYGNERVGLGKFKWKGNGRHWERRGRGGT
ncbi:MAG: hypothetical protein GY777_12310 [Candidatus Brocadiaceae bacterium]|nr:hypothetical protein [Candidatus Brocadiaceae bacterium]